MKIAFSTVACPDWDIFEILDRARLYGYDGVDLRGTSQGLDITKQEAFNRNLSVTSWLIKKSGVVVNSIYSSIRLCDGFRVEEGLAEAERTIEVANSIGARSIRVFGGGAVETDRYALLETAKAFVEKLMALDGAESIIWLIETHDNWLSSEDCLALRNSICRQNIRFIWDFGHTARLIGEEMGKFLLEVGALVDGVHIKDAVFRPNEANSMADGWRYVLPGQGDLPLVSALEELARMQYDGWLIYEHEKRWHPNLEEPEVALPEFVRWLKSIDVHGSLKHWA